MSSALSNVKQCKKKTMSTNESQIRQLITQWMDATRAGDIDTVLGLMADDVVFLLPGRPPMYKAEFASISRAVLLALPGPSSSSNRPWPQRFDLQA